MKTIVKKQDLIQVVQANREGHRGLFLTAAAAYQAFVIRDLENKITALKAGKLVESWTRYPVPEDHTKDYDRVLTMLDMDVRDEIELNEQEVAAYVMDDWDWKRQWNTSNAAYLVQ